MFKKFANCYWFNVLFAVLAGFFIVMQEVWSGGFLVPVLSIAAFAVIGPFFISAGAEIVKMIISPREYSWKQVLIGGAAGAVVGLITLLLV